MKLPFNVVNSSKLAKVMMAASIAVPAVVAPMPFVNEDVEAAEVIEIWSVQDLDNIRKNLSGHYKLMADLDLSGIEWVPIGTSSAKFSGIFDGNGHVIKNLTINKPNTDYVGLFGYVSGGEIKDVVLENVNVVGKDYTGALAGYISNNAKVTNVGVEGGKVTGNNYVGGLVGDQYNNTTINHAYAIGEVTGNDYVGGLVGNQFNSTISHAYATSKVTGNKYVGGLLGDQNGTISHAYATGEVTGYNDSIGGLVGRQLYGTINHAYATGAVKGLRMLGGLVGQQRGTISHAYATGEVTGNDYVGGLVGIQSFSDTLSNAFALNPRITGTSYVGKAIGSGKKFSDVYIYSGMVGMPGMTRDDDYTGVYSEQELLQRSTYENHGFDFSIWLIDEGRSLPYFPFSVNKTGLDGLPIYDNEPPIVTRPIADSTLIAGGNARVLDVGGYFEDPDGDILTYIVTSSDDSVASVEQQGSIIMIRPHQEGEVTITVTAKDGKGGEASTTFTVTVQQNNQVPIVSSPITNQLLVMGDDPLTIDLSQHFHDGDEDELAFAVTSSNPNAVNATVEGSILTLEAENIGYSTITVTASDGKGGEVSTTFTVDVEGLVMPTLTVKDISSHSIEIEWSPVQGAVSYTIYRKEKTQGLMAKAFSFMSLATGGTGLEDGYEEVYHGSATSFVDTNVKKATVYEYIAVAHSANGATSEYSEKIEAATYQSITINWLPVQNEEGEYAAKYRVERYQYEPNGSFIDSKVLGEVNHPTTRYTDHKAHPGKTNRYKVVPIYADGTEGPPIEFPDIEVPTDPDEDVDIEPPVVEDPEQPEEPTEPENPEEPEEPTDPENPNEPEEPSDPENPDEPEEPTDPENPDDPEEPSDPENPDDPEEPSDPENPDEPEEPTDPENPDNPNNPNEPTDPEEPGNPDEPENPEEPTNPNPPDDGDDDENKDDGKKDVVTGPDFITISWFRIPGAAYYEVMKNGQVVYSVEDDPTKDYYSYTDKPIDPTKAYHYEVMPYADDGTPIGDGPIEFVNVPAPTFTVLEKKLGETIVQINFSDELETNNYYSLDGETFQEYTGPISVTKNRTVIYAYARYAPTGDRSPMVTYVVDVEKITEIAPPTFTVISETDEETLLQIHYQTEVETKNYYSYDNKLWHEYTGPITITKNGTRIYARSVEEQTGVKSPTSSIVVYVGVGTNPVGEQPGEIVEDGEEAPSDVLPAPVVKRVLYDVDDTITFFIDANNANLVEVNGKVGMSKNGEFVVTLQTDADGEEYYRIESFDTEGNDSEDVVLTYNLTDFVQMRERDKNVKMQTEGNGTRFTFDEVPNVDRYNLTVELGDLKITSPFTDETQGPINTIRHIPKLPYSEGYQVSVNMVQGLVMVMGKPEIVDYKMVLTNVKFIDNPNFKNSKGVQFEGTYGEVTVDLMKDGELYQRKSGKNTVWFLNLENGEYEVVIDGQSYGTFIIGQPASEIPDLDPTELTVTIIDGAKKNSKGVKVEGTNEVIEVELRKDGEIIGTAKTSKGTAYFHNLTNGTYDVYISGVKVAEFTMGDTQSPETPDFDPTELTVTIIDGAKKNSKGVKVEGTNEVVEVELRKDGEIVGTAKTSKGTAYFHNLTNGTYDVYILGEKVADFTMEDGTSKEDEVNLDDLSILLEDVTLENGIRKGSKAVVVMGTDQVVEVELRKDGETISKAKTTKGKAYFHNLIEGERYEVYIGGKSFGHFIMKHHQLIQAV